MLCGGEGNRTLVEQTWLITQKSCQARKAVRLMRLKFTWVRVHLCSGPRGNGLPP